jgi:hypothetical protein
MLEIERNKYIFKTKEIWFSDYPYDDEDCDSISFRACKNKVDKEGFSRGDFTTLVIDLAQNLEEIWNNMENSSCRRRIKRAEKKGVKIKLNQNYEDFYEIDQSFRESKGLPANSADVDYMKKFGTLFVEDFDGEIIGGHFYLEDEQNIRSLIAASKRLEVSEEMASLIGNANRLVIWKAIQYAKEKGIMEFDMGGYSITTDEQKDRINTFKKSFGGKMATHYVYHKDYSRIYKVIKTGYQLKTRWH